MDPGLVDGVGAGLSGVDPDVQQGAVDIAPDAHRRMHQRDITYAQPVQQDGHRVHQHGGLVGDYLKRGAEAARVLGAMNLHQGLADPATMRELLLSRDQRRRHRRAEGTGLVDVRHGARLRAPVGGLISLGNGAVNRHTVGTPGSACVPTLVRRRSH